MIVKHVHEQCSIISCAMMSHAVNCCAMLCYAMLCYAVLCYAVLRYTMLYYIGMTQIHCQQTNNLTISNLGMYNLLYAIYACIAYVTSIHINTVYVIDMCTCMYDDTTCVHVMNVCYRRFHMTMHPDCGAQLLYYTKFVRTLADYRPNSVELS